MQFASQKSFGLLVPKDKGQVQIESSATVSFVIKLTLENNGCSSIILDMCGYKPSYFKDSKSHSTKKQNTANPAEYSIGAMLDYIRHSNNQSINLYKDLLGNRKLHFILHIAQEIQIAHIQPVLNAIEKYNIIIK